MLNIISAFINGTPQMILMGNASELGVLLSTAMVTFLLISQHGWLKTRRELKERLQSRPETQVGLVAILDSLGTKGIQSREHLESEAAKRGKLSRRVREDLRHAPTEIRSDEEVKVMGVGGTHVVLHTGEGTIAVPRDDLLRSHISTAASDLVLRVPIEVKLKKGGPTPEPPGAVIVFSDTIIVAWPTLREPSGLIDEFGEKFVVNFCLGMESGIYYRGAVAIGEFISVDNQLMGPAVDEAYEWHDKTDWAGVILSPTATYGYEALLEGAKRRKHPWTKFAVPFKDDINLNELIPGGAWCLDWPVVYGGGRKRLMENLSYHRVPVDAGRKLGNIIRFFESRVRKPR
jgi:hypothetical protein